MLFYVVTCSALAVFKRAAYYTIEDDVLANCKGCRWIEVCGEGGREVK
jgi:hypothetical protein